MKKDNDTPNAALLTRAEFGEKVFQAIKAELHSRGFGLTPGKFDPNYPVSRRTVYYIRQGEFQVETLNTLPGIDVKEFFGLVAPE